MKIAVIITTYNRREKTLKCLQSLYQASLPANWFFDIFITDDNSSDGTVEEVTLNFPEVNIEVSSNNLYWARGMNLSWKRAIDRGDYEAFLLLNDDVILSNSFWYYIDYTNQFCINQNNQEGIYVSSTQDPFSKKISYGGRKLNRKFYRIKLEIVKPTNQPIECNVTNANILFVPMNVVKSIGIFDEKYIHGIADYDYSLTAYSKRIPIYVTPNYGGFCTDDHGTNWLSSNYSLIERIKYLKSPKGLAYCQYAYYLWKHFPFYMPYGIIMLWMKTLFPQLWVRFK